MKFTPTEDMKMWRFAIRNSQEEGHTMWEVFKKKTDSTRHTGGLYNRFRRTLLHHLPQTLFHTETKLKLCVQYKFRVDAEFLKALREDADLELDSKGFVAAYTMKPNVRPNMDMELDDEEFLKLTSPIIRTCVTYIEEEDAEMWKFFIENHRKYTKRSETFWKDLAVRMENGRTHRALARRFSRIRDSQLHKIDMDMEAKLELYKRCEIPVAPKYLKTLKEHYDLKVDKDGCIVEYEKIDDGYPRSSSEKKLEQRELISVKTEDIEEPVAKRIKCEKEFYVDSESNPDEIYSESRFEDFGDVENQHLYHNFSGDLEEVHQEEQTALETLYDDESQRPMSQRGYGETRSKEIEQKVVIPDVQLQELEDRIVDKLANVVDAKIAKMSKNLEELLRTEISKVSSQKILPENDEKTSRKKKEFLLNLKNLISPFHAPELEDVVQRIDEAVQNSPEDDVDPNQMIMVRSSLETLLSAIGH